MRGNNSDLAKVAGHQNMAKMLKSDVKFSGPNSEKKYVFTILQCPNKKNEVIYSVF